MRMRIVLAAFLAAAGLTAFGANEGAVNLSLKVTKGYLSVTRAAGYNFTVNNATPAYGGGAQLITTAAVAIALGDISTNGVAWFSNIAASNYVEIGVVDGSTNFLPLIRLNAGESWPFRLSQGVTPWGRANTDSVLLDKIILDN